MPSWIVERFEGLEEILKTSRPGGLSRGVAEQVLELVDEG
jgi:hypothetical protein